MPTTSSAVYVNPIDVKNDKARVHIIAIAVKPGMDNSDPLSGEFSIDYTSPETPLNLTATGGCRQVTLSWSSALRATSYNVYYAPGSTVTTAGTKVPVSSGTSCTVSGLADGTEYAFIVTGVNGSIEGGPSYPPVTATTVGIPSAPTSSTGATWINAAQKGAGFTITVGGLGTIGAVPGDTLTLFLNGNLIATSPLLTPTDISNGHGFSVTGAMLGADGPQSFTAQITDQTSHAGATSSALVLTLDTQAPTINAASFSPSGGWLKTSSSVTLNITTASSEPGLTAGSITVNGVSVGGTFGGSGTAWHATYMVSSGDTNRAQNAIPVSIALTDAAGNTCSPYSTVTGNTPGVDTVAPVISSASFSPSSGWLKIGSSVTLNITTASPETGLTASFITVNGVNVTGTFGGAGTSWYATYMVSGGDTDRPQNAIPISIALTDAAGNTGSPYTTVTGSTPAVDAHAPVITSASFNPSTGWLKAGSSVTLNIATASPENGLTASFITVNGVNVTGTFGGAGTSWYATYMVSGGDTNRAQNGIPISIALTDAVGNTCSPYTMITGGTPGVDTVAPVITQASFSPSGGWLKAGSSVTLNITTASSETGLTASFITVNGVSVGGTFGGSGTAWHASYVVSSGDTNQWQNSIPIDIVLTDAAGNSCSLYTSISGGTPGVDTIAPVITSAIFSPPSGWLGIGSMAMLNITTASPENGLTASFITVNGVNVTGTFGGAGTSWYATYMVSGGDTNRAQNGIPISIALTDAAGNTCSTYSTVTGGTPGVDTVAPSVLNVAIMGGVSIEVDFSEGVYGNPGATTPLGVNSMTIFDQTHPSCIASVNSVSHTPGSAFATYFESWSPQPSSGDTIVVVANQIFDAAGNAAVGPLGQGTW